MTQGPTQAQKQLTSTTGAVPGHQRPLHLINCLRAGPAYDYRINFYIP